VAALIQVLKAALWLLDRGGVRAGDPSVAPDGPLAGR
jgi:hypothetical protein